MRDVVRPSFVQRFGPWRLLGLTAVWMAAFAACVLASQVTGINPVPATYTGGPVAQSVGFTTTYNYILNDSPVDWNWSYASVGGPCANIYWGLGNPGDSITIRFNLPGSYKIRQQVQYNQMDLFPPPPATNYSNQIDIFPPDTETLITTYPSNSIALGGYLVVQSKWTYGTQDVSMDPTTVAEEKGSI
jgi:hypothetical protein